MFSCFYCELGLLQELEEDPELRAKVALYRDPAVDPAAVAARRAAAMTDTDEDEEEVPEVRGAWHAALFWHCAVILENAAATTDVPRMLGARKRCAQPGIG